MEACCADKYFEIFSELETIYQNLTMTLFLFRRFEVDYVYKGTGLKNKEVIEENLLACLTLRT